MNSKPNLPDELEPGKKGYSFMKDLKVNGWGYVALALSVAGEWLLHTRKDLSLALRTIIGLAPIIPALLWGRVFARWIRGMDELHRRLTVEVCLFSTTVTLFLFTALHPLAKAGVFQALGLHEWWLMDWHSWLLTSWLLICFYLIGCKILHRRFK
jgi:hypothetical protein